MVKNYNINWFKQIEREQTYCNNPPHHPNCHEARSLPLEHHHLSLACDPIRRKLYIRREENNKTITQQTNISLKHESKGLMKI